MSRTTSDPAHGRSPCRCKYANRNPWTGASAVIDANCGRRITPADGYHRWLRLQGCTIVGPDGQPWLGWQADRCGLEPGQGGIVLGADRRRAERA